MEQLKNMKHTLTSLVEGELAHIDRADYQEVGSAIDMIKDLSEAIYYCTITEAMEKSDKDKESQSRYYMPYYPTERYSRDRDMDREYGKMYYGGDRGGQGATTYMQDKYYPTSTRDYREGISPMTRKMYMESKEMQHPKEKKMKELEQYMQELGHDLTEMISEASPEEKQILNKKLTDLAAKLHV